jgi:hypothetical protein
LKDDQRTQRRKANWLPATLRHQISLQPGAYLTRSLSGGCGSKDIGTMRQDDSESLDSTTTEWFDEQYYPGPSSLEIDFAAFAKSFRAVKDQLLSYSHMAKEFERISKALFPNAQPPPDIPTKPFTPPVRNHGPRSGKPYRADGKRKW